MGIIPLPRKYFMPGKVQELIKWSEKPYKSQGVLSVYLESQGIIAWSYALENAILHSVHVVLKLIQKAAKWCQLSSATPLHYCVWGFELLAF